jgi:hypothetical protein
VGQNLLVVDWDFFFEEPHPNTSEAMFLYDWGHREGGVLYTQALWPSRATTFVEHGLELPRCHGWESFWDRFILSEEAVLYFADSNKAAVKPEVASSADERTDVVWLYDAHHDAGYNGGTVADVEERGSVSCEDWMVAYKILFDAELHHRYPAWKTWGPKMEPEPVVEVDRQMDHGEHNGTTFDAVFVCRSGAWTPPWSDQDFVKFIYSCPVGEMVEVDDCEPRDWKDEYVTDLIEMHKEMRKRT